jgi:hypothetical protein
VSREQTLRARIAELERCYRDAMEPYLRELARIEACKRPQQIVGPFDAVIPAGATFYLEDGRIVIAEPRTNPQGT